MSKEKKPFKDTKFGKIVNAVASKGGDVVGAVLKAKNGDFEGAFQNLKSVVRNSNDPAIKELETKMSVERMEMIREMNDFELQWEGLQVEREKTLTERWTSDNLNGSSLSKIARPIALFWAMAIVSTVIICGICGKTLSGAYLQLVSMLSVTIFGGYFTVRTIEKRNAKKYQG